MSAVFSPSQNHALEITERVCSVFSLVGCSFICVTFVALPDFRKPINRLAFYASWGNILCNIGTLISLAGINAGQSSTLCQVQGFLIQLCLPADAMWNLAMAVNVYLTVFKKYNAEQLRSMEWIYLLVCYGGPLIPAFAYCFISTASNGRIYGDATLWCWVAGPWDWLRVALCYAPAWFCILTTFTIYLLAGRDIFLKRQQLRSFQPSAAPISVSNPFTSWKTTEVHVTSELADMDSPSTLHLPKELDPHSRVLSHQGFEQYTVTIGRGPERPKSGISSSRSPGLQITTHLQRNVALEANAAAWGYTRCALLFFVSLLITWLPSSLFRVYSLAHPGHTSWPLAYSAGLVLPLMGFWNAVIYTSTSWRAVTRLPSRFLSRHWAAALRLPASQRPLAFGFVEERSSQSRRSRASLSDSMKGLAG